MATATESDTSDLAEVKPLLTAEDLMRIDSDDAQPSYELIDGELREMTMSTLSSWVAKLIVNKLQPLEDAGQAYTFPVDAGIQCFPDAPRKVLKPDGMVVAAAKLPHGPASGYLQVVPDLIVEVISDHDLARDVARKVRDYQDVGVKVIWVVDPDSRTASIYVGRESVTFIHDDGSLTAPGLYDEVSIPLADVLPKV